jgi:hypothetical protein
MESGSTSPGPERQHQPSAGLVELLGRAVTDEHFRDKLYSDQEDATKGYMLTDADRQALANLPREELEQQAQRFGASSATAISIGITIKGTF